MTKIPFLVFVIFSVFIISCEYDQEEPEEILIEAPTTDTTTTDTSTGGGPVAFCDTASATYNTKIKSIITVECAKSGCHNAGSGFGDFTSYAGIKTVVNNGQFENKVIKTGGGMPPAGYSDATYKSYLECWFTKGAPEN